jgi:hypothetical protein
MDTSLMQRVVCSLEKGNLKQRKKEEDATTKDLKVAIKGSREIQIQK